MVGIMGLFNGGGRIVWATISDYIGRPNVYTLFFAFQIVAFFMLPNITIGILFSIIVYMIMTCYGGGFASFLPISAICLEQSSLVLFMGIF